MEIMSEKYLITLGQVKRFLDEHAEALGIAGNPARATLEAAFAEAESLRLSLDPISFQRLAAQARTARLRQEIHGQWLALAARAAAGARSEIRELVALRAENTRGRMNQIIDNAQEVARAVRLHAELFEGAGVPASFSDIVESRVEELKQSLTILSEVRRKRIEARKGIILALRRGMRAMRVIDRLIVPQLRANPTLQAGWTSTQVRLARGVTDETGTAPDTGVTPLPATTPDSPDGAPVNTTAPADPAEVTAAL
jgi:hypothetical protein